MILVKDHIKVVVQKIEHQEQWLELLQYMQTPKKLCILLNFFFLILIFKPKYQDKNKNAT